MSARRKARKKALDLLFESDLRSASVLSLLEERPIDDLSQADYVRTLVVGVKEHQEKIDELIHIYAEGWEMDRMPAIDRNLLRIALFEILWEETLDDKVAVSEAVEIAQELSTTESGAYINGLLGRIILLKSVISLT
ncbi:MAG: transcription antitermination factor NusB [Actinomycetota bacterium]